VHGSDEVPEPLPIDDGGRLDVHDEVVKDGSHDSDLSVCVCLSHVSQGGEAGRGQALVLQRVSQELGFRDLGRYDLEIKYFGIFPRRTRRCTSKVVSVGVFLHCASDLQGHVIDNINDLP